MDFSLTEEHIMIRDAARDFAQTELLPGVIERDENEEFPAEQIKKMGGKVTLVVRGAPILNDATMEDVKIHGIAGMVDEILTTGSNAIGVCLEEAPPELTDALSQASLIISKGMANYETMSEYGFGPIAYLLRTKCQVVADDLGLDKGILIAKLVE